MHVSLVHSWQDAGQQPARLGVVAKRSYRIARGRTSRIADAPAILREPLIRDLGTDDKELVLPADTEAARRVLTDVLVFGHAHSRRGATRELTTGIQVGRARKVVRVTGDRKIRLEAAGALAADMAEGFTKMPLSWSRAYGGRDEHAEELLRSAPGAPLEVQLGSFAYPRNRLGKGFVADLERERLEGMLMPNLDDPEDPVTPDRLLAKDALDWADRPSAAGYGPLDPLTFPRSMFWLLRPDWNAHARPFRELALGAILERDLADRPVKAPPDPRFYNCAPAGLAVCRLHGGERVTLWNLHRDHETLEFDLPSERPQLIVEPPGCRAYELEPALGMVLIEPDEDRVTMTWAGSMDVAAVFLETMCQEMKHAIIWNR